MSTTTTETLVRCAAPVVGLPVCETQVSVGPVPEWAPSFTSVDVPLCETCRPQTWVLSVRMPLSSAVNL